MVTISAPPPTAETRSVPSATDRDGRVLVQAGGLVGLLLVQILIGYEWFISGLTKIVRGGFPSGLSGELTDLSRGDAGWYKSFLDSVVIPHGSLFGYLIEIGEVAVGVALVVASLVWLVRWNRLSYPGMLTVVLVTAVASAGGVIMNVNFHLAGAGTHPWLIPRDAFEEGVDLDSLMPAIQIVMIGVCVYAIRILRRDRARTVRGTGQEAARV